MIPLVHFEIHASDIARAQKFYQEVFQWEYKVFKMPKGGPDGGPFEYVSIMTKVNGKGIDGGFVQRTGPAPIACQSPSGFVCTMEVPNIDETLATVTAAGGSIAMPRGTIEGVGYLAYCIDTEDNMFGILQPLQPQQQ